MIDYDYSSSDASKRKKKHRKQRDDNGEHVPPTRVKPLRNFQIIDDDIDISKLKPSEESEMLVDLLDPEGPSIADASEELVAASRRVVQKVDVINNQNKWIKVDLCQDEDGEFDLAVPQTKSLFRKRGEKSVKIDVSESISNQQNEDADDDDLDFVPRRKAAASNSTNERSGSRADQRDNDDNDDDLDVRRKPSASSRCEQASDLSPVRKRADSSATQLIDEEIDETKCRVRRVTRDEELKRAKKEEKLLKYMEWGKGLVQKKDKEEKLKSDLYEADKPLARYKDDKDLDTLLKSQDREDDPMLEYLQKKRNDRGEVVVEEKKVARYRGPPAPPNRYKIQPGPRWDGVDRSNGFEKKHFESIVARKSKQEDAYKWSVEDM